MNIKCLKIFLYLSLLSLTTYVGGAESQAVKGTPESFKHSSEIKFWQSYTASPKGGMTYWNNDSQQYEVKKLNRINETFRSGYGYVNVEGNLIFTNITTREGFIYWHEGYSSLEEFVYFQGAFSYTPFHLESGNIFESGDRYFYKRANLIRACLKYSAADCVDIEVIRGSYTFVYAEKDSNVLVVTSWGDAVKFNGVSWCRMAKNSDDVFSCKPNEPMVIEPRSIQFYSSLQYQGEVLLGEWPTGSIYVFDGQTLKPSKKWTPPPMREREVLGYEAQSMAEYCGDLFVGYWPKGELWKFSREKNQWEYFKRFFSSRGDETFIPWLNRPADKKTPAFFGQRITALIPHERSLYVVTSNYGGWVDSVSVDHLLPSELDEYGSIYEIKGKDCLTVY